MDNTKSIWEASADEITVSPPLQGSLETEVVIIGGGITGLTTAMLLGNAGKKVVVLEALRLGLGTTGNSTGNLYVTVDEHLSQIRKKWNPDVMKAVVRSRRMALDFIEAMVKKYNIDCDFYRTSFTHFAEVLTDDIDDFIKREYDALHEADLEAVISANPGLPFEVKKALSVNGQAQLHPLSYVRGLARNLGGTCAIYENSQVLEHDEKKGIVKTQNGTVKAEHIIMATHTPKGVFMVQTVMGPYREHGVAAKLQSGTCPKGIFWGLNPPKHSIRNLRAGGQDYVMVIGDKYKTGQNEHNTEYISRLEKYLSARFDIGPTQYVWGGQHYRPADGLPYIGRHGERMYLLTGFATDGLLYGTLAAMIVSDLILGKKNPYAETYKADRFTPLKSAKEFIKENADVLVQYMKDFPWNVDAKTLDEIPAGTGKVIEHKGEKIAVYKDEKKQVHMVSAVCTHMKCVVAWNPAEKTWDCPCHGSRFRIDGQLIEGPAVGNLPAKK